MKIRSRVRTRGRTGSLSLMSRATAKLGTAPYHYWDFTTNQALFAGANVGPVTSTPGWSFTRASAGYAQTTGGLLVLFASGTPRITDRGMLVEEARTNVALQSQTLDNGAIVKANTTVTANNLTAPDGTLTMDTVQAVAGSAGHRIAQGITWGSAAVTTFSVYAKYVNNRWLALTLFDGTTTYAASFDLLNGVVGVTSNATSAIESLGGGMYRVQLTTSSAILAAAGDFGVCVNQTNTASLETWTAAGTEQVGVWGLQAEVGTGATSYTPTTTVAVTRAADIASVTSPAVGFPLSMDIEFQRSIDAGAAERLMQLDDGTENNRAQVQIGATDLMNSILSVAAVNQYNATVGSATTAGPIYKYAVRFATNDCINCLGGTLGTQDTVASVPATLGTLRFGATSAGASVPNAYYRTAAIFNSGLAAAALQRATA